MQQDNDIATKERPRASAPREGGYIDMCADPPDAVEDEGGDAMLGGEGRFAKSASASTAVAAAGRWIISDA